MTKPSAALIKHVADVLIAELKKDIKDGKVQDKRLIDNYGDAPTKTN